MRRYVIYKNIKPSGYAEDQRKYDSYDHHYYDDNMYYEDEKHRRHDQPSYYRDDYDDRNDMNYYDDEYDYYEDRSYRRSGNSDRYRHNSGRTAQSFVLPNEETAYMIMNATAFGEYIARHGYHFTNELADCASKMLINANKREHRWTADQVRQNLAIQGITDLGKCTLGDITFLANMAYSDFYPEILPTESACIKYAIAISKDPDGYDGIAFSRWISDLIGKRITSIQWEKYV